MSYIEEYWNNKDQRAKVAREHTKEMEDKYGRAIDISISGTKIYDTNFAEKVDTIKVNKKMENLVDDLDSVSAIYKHRDGKTAVLNFSSYKNPGGMFLNVSKAQEECLCHESFLYNVLKAFQPEFYDWNNNHKNKALYLNRGIYSPCIFLITMEKKKGVMLLRVRLLINQRRRNTKM